MRALVVVVMAGGLAASCGPVRCPQVPCEPGFECSSGVCSASSKDGGRDAGRLDASVLTDEDAGAADAGSMSDGGTASACGTCGLATPICDEAAGRCVRCTLAQGCTGGTPVCDISFQGGLGRCERCVADGGGCGGSTPICDTVNETCVECLRHPQCPSGQCDLVTSRCLPDAGVTFDAGVDAGRPICPGPRDAGVTRCVVECPQGFTCSGNECVLNGGGGGLQVTLRWDSTEDLDLHLDEPALDGGCEIFYGDRSPSCAIGSLDLDSQAGCSVDLVLIENIIYPPTVRPTAGTYAVRIDHYTSCSPIQWVPFELEVRKGAVKMGVCGVFQRTDPDWSTGGSRGAGRPVMTFTYP